MLVGVVVVLLAALAIIFGSYRVGKSTCLTDETVQLGERNTSVVVIAVGLMFLMSGMLMTVAGSTNPMNAIVNP